MTFGGTDCADQAGYDQTVALDSTCGTNLWADSCLAAYLVECNGASFDCCTP